MQKVMIILSVLPLIVSACTLEDVCGSDSHKENGKCVPNESSQSACGYPPQDCKKLPHADIETVRCDKGACFIASCEKGYVLKDGNCVSITEKTDDCGVLRESCRGIDGVVAMHCNKGKCIIESCKTGYALNNNECSLAIEGDNCTEEKENVAKCLGNERVYCSGGKWKKEPCANGCVDGLCVNACTPLESHCEDGVLSVCATNGKDWTTIPCEHGCKDDEHCQDGGTQVETECADAEDRCNQGSVEKCIGGHWQEVEKCNHACQDSQCVAGDTIEANDPCDPGTTESRCDGDSLLYCDPSAKRVRSKDCTKNGHVCRKSVVMGSACVVPTQEISKYCSAENMGVLVSGTLCSSFDDKGVMNIVYCENIGGAIYGVNMMAESICNEVVRNELSALTCFSSEQEEVAFKACDTCVMVPSQNPDAAMIALCDGVPVQYNESLFKTTDEYVPCSGECMTAGGVSCEAYCKNDSASSVCMEMPKRGRVGCFDPCSVEGSVTSKCDSEDGILRKFECRKYGDRLIYEITGVDICVNACGSYESCDSSGIAVATFCESAKVSEDKTVGDACRDRGPNLRGFCHQARGQKNYTCEEICDPGDIGKRVRKCETLESTGYVFNATCQNVDGYDIYLKDFLPESKCPNGCNADGTDCL